MYVENVFTIDYDSITDIFLTICTNNDDKIDTFIPILLVTILYGLSFLCLMSLMVYTLIKTLFNNKRWRNFYNQIIQIVV